MSLETEIVCLEADNAAKDAALRVVGEEIWPLIAPGDGYAATGEDWRAVGKRLSRLFKHGRLAALSPSAGKGWLPRPAGLDGAAGGLRILADWFALHETGTDDEVQRDLRRWATALDTLGGK